MTQGFLQYALAYVRSNGNALLKNKKSLTLFPHNLVPEHMSDHTGHVVLIPDGDAIMLVAQLQQNKEVVFSLSCRCTLAFKDKERQKIEVVEISGWRIDEAM